MILLALQLNYMVNHIKDFFVSKTEWILMISGAVIVIVAFCWDYSRYILEHHSISKLWSLTEAELFDINIQYIPLSFNWLVFLIGIAFIFWSMIHIHFRNRSNIK